MSIQANVTLVEEAYASFKSGNIEHLVNNLLAEAIEWSVPKVEHVPYTGLHRGRKEVAQFFVKLADFQEVQEFEPQEFIAQGDKVAVLGHYRWRVKSTGKGFESDWVHVFTIKDGKVIKFQEYADSLAVQRAASD